MIKQILLFILLILLIYTGCEPPVEFGNGVAVLKKHIELPGENCSYNSSISLSKESDVVGVSGLNTIYFLDKNANIFSNKCFKPSNQYEYENFTEIEISKDGKTAYLNASLSDTVIIWDIEKNSEIKTIQFNNAISQIELDESKGIIYGFSPNRKDDAITVMDIESETSTELNLDISAIGLGFALFSNNTKAIVSGIENIDDNSTHIELIYDIENEKELGRIEYGHDGDIIADYTCNKAGEFCYSANNRGFRISKLDVENFELVKHYSENIKSLVEAVELTNDGKWLFVGTSGSSNDVHIINTTTMEELAIIDDKECMSLSDIAVAPDGKKLYVACMLVLLIYDLNLP